MGPILMHACLKITYRPRGLPDCIYPQSVKQMHGYLKIKYTCVGLHAYARNCSYVPTYGYACACCVFIMCACIFFLCSPEDFQLLRQN